MEEEERALRWGRGGVVEEEDGSGCTERWMDMPEWAVETVCVL